MKKTYEKPSVTIYSFLGQMPIMANSVEDKGSTIPYEKSDKVEGGDADAKRDPWCGGLW